MARTDPIPERIKAFDRTNGGGVSVGRIRGGYTLTLTAAGARVARLKPVGNSEEMRVCHWAWRGRWKDVGEMGGLVLPLDEALKTIVETDIFWSWT